MTEQLNYTEIKRRLKKPLDPKLLSHKTQGGTKIAYVNITTLKDELDARCAPNHWEALIKSTTVCGENLIMIVSLVIHASDGVYCQDGTGLESINLRGYGDVASNAYSQAVRRASESHGLGRELWRLELSDEQKEIVREETRPVSLVVRIAKAQDAINALGGKYEEIKDNEIQADYFNRLVEQYNRLKSTKENK